MTEPEQLRPGFRALYGEEPRVFRAPGRVNVIGEHVDYNDGMVMPAAIDLATWVAVSPRDDRKLVVQSQDLEGSVELDLDRQRPKAAGNWSDYVYGVALHMGRRGIRTPGANILVASEVPIGAGLSSSAALEVASALALASVAGVELAPEETARLCQQAESDFCGRALRDYGSVHRLLWTTWTGDRPGLPGSQFSLCDPAANDAVGACEHDGPP